MVESNLAIILHHWIMLHFVLILPYDFTTAASELTLIYISKNELYLAKTKENTVNVNQPRTSFVLFLTVIQSIK